MTPTQTPALKIPPITLQELTVIANPKMQSHKDAYFFMSSSFTSLIQKLCRFKKQKRCHNDK
jgi:hypothetical protein